MKEVMMKHKTRIIVTLVFISILVFVQSVTADQAKEKAAISAAKAWLTLVDDGKYFESWDEAAQYFKNAVTKE